MIIQIQTGAYTYKNGSGEIFSSHCVYGLTDSGQVLRWVPAKERWIDLERIEIKNLKRNKEMDRLN